MSGTNALAEELEALKSIYDKDLSCNDSEIIITLFPLQEKEKKEIYVQVDLCVTCSDAYPKKEPDVALKNVKGLTDSLVESLYYKLKELAKSLRGEVMIYNLAYFVQEFLTENNRPGRKSCYEEMIIRKEQLKQEEYQSEVYKKTKLIMNIQEKQKEMLQSTENDSDEYEDDEDYENVSDDNTNYYGERKRDFSVSSLNSLKLKSNISFKMEEIDCEHRNCKYIQFNNKILRGRCLEHHNSSITYCALDNSTGDQLLLQEWVLKPKNKSKENLEFIQQTLEEIRTELANLKKLCHENLLSYLDFKQSYEKGEWIVHILQEHATNFNLNVFIKRCTVLDVNFIRHIVYGILNALDHLHSHRTIHGDINEYSIYFSKTGVVKVANYGIKKTLDDLHHSCKCEGLIQLKEKTSQKSDIFDVGHLLLKTVKVSSTFKDSIMVPEFQPPELKEFVEKCLIENEESRWTARKLLNHRFLKVKETKQTPSKKRPSEDKVNIVINTEENEKPYEMFIETNNNENSRLSKEFKILNHLGSGSFGKVLKVKNKLDGSVYAIKAIMLNMKNKQLDRKMIREVKLLSKLNHENVVRYYTSWIETDCNSTHNSFFNEDSDCIDGKSSNKIFKSNVPVVEYENENDEEEDDDDEDDEDEDEDDDDVDGVEDEDENEDENESSNVNKNDVSQKKKDQSSYVIFLRDSKTGDSNENDSKLDKSRDLDRSDVEPNRTMYIQMEFCEKSTLRIAINETGSVKLCEDESRLWRLFREIVEGLAYVHGQGMIHRDLKPENIFLDSSDHVKIGDFGLATISVVSKSLSSYVGVIYGGGDNDASSHNIYDDFHTGKVGTSLYVAPELDKTFGKSYYNRKVDIYSLGIIFFEMCNGPFSTDMERVETLLNLRKFEIILPSFWEEKPLKQRNLVKILLNHDPKSRLSCQEILEGNYLPPAEFEYEQLQDIMRQTLINPKSKAYKYLVSSCFDQEVRVEEDITYQWENVRSEKQHFLLDLVKERVENILKKHGAIYLSAPLLLPQSEAHKNIETRVQLMTHSGSIVNLPYDLRISFARFVACKAYTRLRRYVVERVYREKKVHGLHPKEQYECAFDLITPSSGIENAELEILSVVQEIVNDFKSLQSRNCVIRLNHSLLLKAVLVHFNIEKWYSDIFKILANTKDSKHLKSKLESNLQQLGIPNTNVLLNLFTKEESLNNIKKELFSIINKRGQAFDLLNKALQQLISTFTRAERIGIKMPLKISMGTVCNSEHCSDIMFDVSYQIKQERKKKGFVTLMSGCRYDSLIANFRRLFELTSISPGYDPPSAVGLSVHLDKIALVLKEDNTLSEYCVVCSIGNNVSIQTKDSMAKKLWEAGIKCYVEQTVETLKELTDYCRENKIIHIVNLKDEKSGFAYVMTWDNDKNLYLEKKINVRDVTEYILKYFKTFEGRSPSIFSRQSSEPHGRPSGNESHNGSQTININIITDDKLTSSQRRRYENQIRTRMTSVASLFSFKIRIEIVAVFLDEQKVKEIALNFKTSDSSNDCCVDVESIADRNLLKKYILKICCKLKSLFADHSNTVIILYSLPQDKYHFILEC